MIKLDFSKLSTYRWRYLIGYGLVATGLIGVLIFVGLFLPGSISNQEMQSVVTSNSISLHNLNSFTVINLPYYILQKISLALFGVSIISIKLPSIILAFLSIIGIVIIMRQWFKPAVGVLATLIAITTGQFIFIAQDGTPGILYLFWPVVLLLLACLISSQKKFRMIYKTSFCIAAALSLYTPLGIYVLIALISAIFLHPHLRFLIRQLWKPKIIVAIFVSLLILIPLIITIAKTPGLALQLLGIPSSKPDIGANLSSLGAQYLNFYNPGGTTLITPFFELGSFLIILIGIYYVIITRETAKSYVIGIWAILLLPIITLNPNSTSITFLPLVLLLASGLNELIAYWYGLFPRNPYARAGGLIPIIVLVAVLVLSGADRYIEGYRYDPGIVPNFSKDIVLIPNNIKNLVVSSNELAFYQVVAKYDKQYYVSLTPMNSTFLATREAKQSFAGYTIEKIITTSTSEQADRFYLYKK